MHSAFSIVLHAEKNETFILLSKKIGLADKNVSLLFVQEINLSLKV